MTVTVPLDTKYLEMAPSAPVTDTWEGMKRKEGERGSEGGAEVEEADVMEEEEEEGTKEG